MKRSRFTEEQTIAVLKEQEAGTPTADVCRKHGISSATFYKWKAKYGGLEVSDARKLRALEDENGKLKKLLAEAMLDNAILKEQEAGSKTADVCRKHGISSATFYHWKAKYGGQSVSEAKRLRALESENARLKKLFADAMLDNAMLKDLLSKKW